MGAAWNAAWLAGGGPGRGRGAGLLPRHTRGAGEELRCSTPTAAVACAQVEPSPPAGRHSRHDRPQQASPTADDDRLHARRYFRVNHQAVAHDVMAVHVRLCEGDFASEQPVFERESARVFAVMRETVFGCVPRCFERGARSWCRFQTTVPPAPNPAPNAAGSRSRTHSRVRCRRTSGRRRPRPGSRSTELIGDRVVRRSPGAAEGRPAAATPPHRRSSSSRERTPWTTAEHRSAGLPQRSDVRSSGSVAGCAPP